MGLKKEKKPAIQRSQLGILISNDGELATRFAIFQMSVCAFTFIDDERRNAIAVKTIHTVGSPNKRLQLAWHCP